MAEFSVKVQFSVENDVCLYVNLDLISLRRLFVSRYVRCTYGVKETCILGCFLGGFQQPLYEGILRLGYFQPSTLAWLLGISWWRIPPLRGLLRELLPPCIFDVVGGRVWCLKRQGEAVVQIWGEGVGNPCSNFSIFGKINFRAFFQHDGEVWVYSEKVNREK